MVAVNMCNAIVFENRFFARIKLLKNARIIRDCRYSDERFISLFGVCCNSICAMTGCGHRTFIIVRFLWQMIRCEHWMVMRVRVAVNCALLMEWSSTSRIELAAVSVIIYGFTRTLCCYTSNRSIDHRHKIPTLFLWFSILFFRWTKINYKLNFFVSSLSLACAFISNSRYIIALLE